MQLWRFGLLLFLISPAAFAVERVDLTFAIFPVIIIVIIFLALTYMLAKAIASPRLEAWFKTELREFVAAVILIVLVTTFLMGPTGGISIALTGEADYIGVSKDIIDAWIANYDNAFMRIIGAATRLRASATYSPYINAPLWYVSISYSISPVAGIGVFLGTLNRATQAVTNVIFLFEGARLLLSFLELTIPKVLLPLAFMLRLIPFTRKLGNTLIALSIAGIVFLPFSVILADSMNENIVIQPTLDLDTLNANPWAMMLMEPACELLPIRFLLSLTDVLFAIIVCLPTIIGFPVCYNVVKETVYPIILNTVQMINSELLLAWLGAFTTFGSDIYADQVFSSLWHFLKEVNNLVLLGYLDLILIAIITIVGARSLSAALGGEWYMAGIQRLI